MRILSVQASNFASYKELSFELTNKGLALIQGPTGAGKSTLCDLVPWCLFGQTAKNGAVDEVLSWPGDKATSGTVHLQRPEGALWITRVRGKNRNDLYYTDFNTNGTLKGGIESNPKRGKDLNDTQKIINNLLGLDANLYLSGSYLHEFSPAAQFFTTTAKNRRLICEQIVDLALAKKLQLKLSESKKATYNAQGQVEGQIMTRTSNIAVLNKVMQSNNNASHNWQKTQDYKRSQLETKLDNFERARNDVIQALEVKLSLEPRCQACGNKTDKEAHSKAIKARIKDEGGRVNPYVEQLIALKSEKSPYIANLEDTQNELRKLASEQDQLVTQLQSLNHEYGDLETLEEITDAYRSVTIHNAIGFIESSTNDLLTRYFDGEINVQFETSSADKIEVNITKDGNQCSYTQLSKGQRCLLKLCFGISIMRAVSNHSGVTFNQVWFDEALDGLSEELKIKSYRLLEAVAADYESVFVVDHSSELKNLFENKISVQLIDGHSELSES